MLHAVHDYCSETSQDMVLFANSSDRRESVNQFVAVSALI